MSEHTGDFSDPSRESFTNPLHEAESGLSPGVEAQLRRDTDTLQFAFTKVPSDILVAYMKPAMAAREAAGLPVTDQQTLFEEAVNRLRTGDFGLDATATHSLAERVIENGFHESNGRTLWDTQPNPSSIVGRIAMDARQIVQDTLTSVLTHPDVEK